MTSSITFVCEEVEGLATKRVKNKN